MTADRPGTSKSGPCLTNQHDRCRYSPCGCACHQTPECTGCPFAGCPGCRFQGGE